MQAVEMWGVAHGDVVRFVFGTKNEAYYHAESTNGLVIAVTVMPRSAELVYDKAQRTIVPAVGKFVYCVRCIEPDGNDVVHIFSTLDKAEAFRKSDPRGHVSYDYAVDVPERYEQAAG